MLRGQRDEKIVLAAHGKWISELRASARTIEQRLRVIEQRISMLETQLVELNKIRGKIDEPAALDIGAPDLKRGRSGELRTDSIDIRG